MATFSYLCFFIFHFVISVVYSSDGVQLILVNNCRESIRPGILATNGHETPYQGRIHLCSSEQTLLQLPKSWSWQIWPRQGCRFDEAAAENNISSITTACQTGDCNGVLHCNGSSGALPTTLLEMTFTTQTLHYYDVSLVDGFNIPVSMRPVSSNGGEDGRTQCGVAACEADLNVCCRERLAVKRGGKVAGCKSACVAARKDQYCCTREFANPERCKPTIFSHSFKAICPKAYSYAYDDENALQTCKAPRYVITFSPPKME